MSTVTRVIASHSSPSRPFMLSLGLACAAAVGCSSEEEPSVAFVNRSTEHAAASFVEPLKVNDDWLAYRLSEAGQDNTDFNGDGDTSDAIAVRVNTNTRVVEVLNVAALEVIFVNETLFILVDEAQDSTDWNGDLDETDRVLLYLAAGATTPVFYDTVPDAFAGGLVSAADRLLYPSATAPTASMESNLYLAAVTTEGAVPDAPSDRKSVV